MDRRIIFIFSWLLIAGSLLYSQSLINRLRVPITITGKMSIGYDNNFLRLSEKEIREDDVTEYGISSTLDSPILKPAVKLIYSPAIIDGKTTNIITSVSYSHFTQAHQKSYLITNFSLELKFEKRGRLSEMEEGRFKSQVRYHKDKQPWGLEGANIAIPAATQNEIGEKEAKDLLDSGVETICEASNMPLTSDATKYVRGLKTMTILPAKAVNAGGVAVSGLERSQNAEYQHWSADKVDEKLQSIMSDIFKTCLRYGEGDFVKGANIAGFERVAKAVIAYGAN